jgi:hypothetical protein
VHFAKTELIVLVNTEAELVLDTKELRSGSKLPEFC